MTDAESLDGSGFVGSMKVALRKFSNALLWTCETLLPKEGMKSEGPRTEPKVPHRQADAAGAIQRGMLYALFILILIVALRENYKQCKVPQYLKRDTAVYLILFFLYLCVTYVINGYLTCNI